MQAIGADETRFMKFLTGQNEDGNKHRDATKKRAGSGRKKDSGTLRHLQAV